MRLLVVLGGPSLFFHFVEGCVFFKFFHVGSQIGFFFDLLFFHSPRAARLYSRQSSLSRLEPERCSRSGLGLMFFLRSPFYLAAGSGNVLMAEPFVFVIALTLGGGLCMCLYL